MARLGTCPLCDSEFHRKKATDPFGDGAAEVPDWALERANALLGDMIFNAAWDRPCAAMHLLRAVETHRAIDLAEFQALQNTVSRLHEELDTLRSIQETAQVRSPR